MLTFVCRRPAIQPAMIHREVTPDPSGIEQRRREPRLDASAEVSIRKLGASAAEARLINISSHGFMAQTNVEIEAGARVWLNLPGVHRVNALIVWVRGTFVGGEFSAPIDPAQVLGAIGSGARSAYG